MSHSGIETCTEGVIGTVVSVAADKPRLRVAAFGGAEWRDSVNILDTDEREQQLSLSRNEARNLMDALAYNWTMGTIIYDVRAPSPASLRS